MHIYFTGDRILAVNGNSLEQVTHEKAVSLLKTTSSTVELVVSQSPHNVSALGECCFCIEN